MKSLKNNCWLWALLAGLLTMARPAPVAAAEGREVAMERLERLEMRVNDMGEHQENFMREMGGQIERVGAQMERIGEMVRVERGNLREPMPPGVGPRPLTPPRDLAPGAHLVKGIANMLKLCFFVGIICNILLAIWISTDIRKRGEGSAIFVAVALLAGVPAALIYAITRIGDRKPEKVA